MQGGSLFSYSFHPEVRISASVQSVPKEKLERPNKKKKNMQKI